MVHRVAVVARQPEARLVRLARRQAATAVRRTTGSRRSAGRRGSGTRRRGQYYLHSFLVEQPDLNWRNPEVVQAMHDVLRFWMERGVDGFRIDVMGRVAQGPGAARQPAATPAWKPGEHVAQPVAAGQRPQLARRLPRRARDPAVLDEFRRPDGGRRSVRRRAQLAHYYGGESLEACTWRSTFS